MEGIFNLLLAAIVSKKHLNIQETGVSTLAKFLNLGMLSVLFCTCFLIWIYTEYPRQEFLQLGHLDALLGMLSMNEDIGSQLAGLKLLKVLLNNGKKVFSQQIKLVIRGAFRCITFTGYVYQYQSPIIYCISNLQSSGQKRNF